MKTPRPLDLLALALLAPAPAFAQDAPPAAAQELAGAPEATAQPAPQPAEPPAAEPWERAFTVGYEQLLALGSEGRVDDALELGRRLLADNRYTRMRARHAERFGARLEPVYRALEPFSFALGFETRSAEQRAEVHYALGVFQALGGGVQSAEEAFQTARGLAGPGATRLDATYNLGALDLMLAEELRDKLPEVHGRTNNALSPGFQHEPEDEQDTLPLARQAYEDAREHFVERLRADWRDADTRANVELIQRRLRELDEIEEERRQDEGQERSDEDEQDQEPQDSADSSDQGTPSSDESEEQPEGSEETQDEQESEGEQDSEEESAEEPEDEGEEQEGEADEPEERFLTEEEMKRLFDELKKHNEKGEELIQVLRGVQQRKAEKDW
jgi:hypothetical protein